MFLIRPIEEKDEEALIKLSFDAQAGILSLPKDRKLLKEKIHNSILSFQKEVFAPNNEKYLFALEDTETGKIGGVCGIYSKTGVEYPTYFYEITEERLSRSTKLPNKLPKQNVLVVKEHKHGPTENCSLLLSPDYRKEGLGKLLSLSRLLFIASNRIRFDDIIIASLRGVMNSNNKCVFWENVGRQFFDVEITTLHELLKHDQEFVKNILPQFPLYISLLSQEAQSVIGKPHQNSAPALNILVNQGFNVSNEIDPFDGGPILSAFIDQLPFVTKSQCSIIKKIHNETVESSNLIICNNSMDYRACFASIKQFADGSISISKNVAKTLCVDAGDIVRYSEIM
ncbi:MAG: arginine N-succinyltransferase [Chlamydiota bacterium]|nr:arginine N-succinyltransferase [Chlamydiota bacterium]